MKPKGTNEGKIEELINEWQTQLHLDVLKLQKFKFKADKLDMETRGNFLKKVKALEEKIANAQAKLEENRKRYENLKDGSEEAWDDLKSGGQTAWEDLKTDSE